jgi:hypothetical protein
MDKESSTLGVVFSLRDQEYARVFFKRQVFKMLPRLGWEANPGSFVFRLFSHRSSYELLRLPHESKNCTFKHASGQSFRSLDIKKLGEFLEKKKIRFQITLYFLFQSFSR